MSFNVLMALVGALGMYLVFLGLYSYVTVSLSGPPGGLLYGPEASLRRERLTGSLFERLDQMLYQARIPVSAGEFLGVSALLGAAVGASDALRHRGSGRRGGRLRVRILPVLHLPGSAPVKDARPVRSPAASRAARHAGRLSLQGPIARRSSPLCGRRGPEICRPDFEELAATFSKSPIDYARLHRLLGLRGSYALDRAAEALLQFHTMPQRIPEILDLLIPRLRKEIRVRREMRSDTSGPRWQLVIVVAVPFLVILFLRFAAPEYIRFYSTAVGQLVFIVAFLADVILYLGASAVVNRMVNPIPYRRRVPERRRSMAPAPPEAAGPGNGEHLGTASGELGS